VSLWRRENYKWRDSPYLPKLKWRECIRWLFIGVVCEAILVYFFYRSLWAFIALLWIPCVLWLMQWEKWKKQILFQIELGFKEWIYYIKGGLYAGKSIENAVLACKDSFETHMGSNHPIQLGLFQIYRALENNVPIEECIAKVALETGIEVIEDFAVIFQISKRQGGHMIEVFERIIIQIYEKVELREEIYALFAAKKMEQRIMSVMPFAIMVFIGSTSQGYFDALYHNAYGICVMSICLMVYLLGFLWGEKMTEVHL